MKTPKIIAFYLPQFHPTPENDKWWGKGFTEWTNVGKAKPLFKGHYQPRVPADLGYYDLRIPEVREQQAELAKEAGIYGFCYWHYWFGNGKRLLEKIWDDVIESGKPNFPICLGWANHSWYAKLWDNRSKDKLLIKQEYPGIEDYTKHFHIALKAFQDKRYIKFENKPVFFIYDPQAVPEKFLQIWNKLAIENGYNGICFIGRINKEKSYEEIINKGFDYVIMERMNDVSTKKNYIERRIHQLINVIRKRPRNCYTYKESYPYFINEKIDIKEQFIPTIIPCWDHSPRSIGKGTIFHNSTPDLFALHIRQVLNLYNKKTNKSPFIFLKSWNEWAEGNYMEPDLKYGKQYIQTLKKELTSL